MTNYEASTPRLWLERITLKHLDDFHVLWSSEKSLIWSKRPPTKSHGESRDFMEKSSLYRPEAGFDKYAIVLKPTPISVSLSPLPSSSPDTSASTSTTEPRMIGVVGTNGDGHELVYMLHCDFWERGYMSEALTAFLKICWDLPLRRDRNFIVAHIDTENWASMKVIEKVGGRKGETLKAEYVLARDLGDDKVVPKEKLRDMRIWYLDRPE